ncbi:MAG TPA: hypothetical protein PK450_10455 [Paracoccaceae bacterium]|nr:hypothetical protein [Paracoccaceae bacterium]
MFKYFFPSLPFVIAVAVPALAALAPDLERQRELSAILADPAVLAGFEGRPITEIRWISEDLFEVRAGNCVRQVYINGTDTLTNEGPRPFTVQPLDLICAD